MAWRRKNIEGQWAVVGEGCRDALRCTLVLVLAWSLVARAENPYSDLSKDQQAFMSYFVASEALSAGENASARFGLDLWTLLGVLRGPRISGAQLSARNQQAQVSFNQPVEPRRILFAPTLVPSTGPPALRKTSPTENALFDASGQRAYILNTALSQRLPGGSLANAPNFVDFVDLGDFSFAERVDLDSDLDTFAPPQDMALSNEGKTIVVAVRGTDTRFDTFSTPIESHLTIIDVDTAQRVRRILLPARHWPSSVVLSPDGAFAYVLASERLEQDLGRVVALVVLTVNLASGDVVHRVELPFQDLQPGDIVITPDGGQLFARIQSGIYVVDTLSQTVTAAIPSTLVLNAPLKLAMSPLGNEVYAEGRKPGEFPRGIAVIDVATATVKDVFPVPNAQGGSSQDVGVSAEGRILLHLDSLSGLFTLIDRLTGDVIDQIDTGSPVVLGAIAEAP